MANVGIWGSGVSLPEHVRTNDWWTEDVVSEWKERELKRSMRSADAPGDWDTPGARLVKEALAESQKIPFMGIRERRVLADDKQASDMEADAATQALAAAGIAPKDVDFLVIQSTVPDFLNVSNGPLVHERLGLRPDCMIVPLEGMCNAFQLHLQMADMIVGSKRGKVGLLVQSTVLTRLFSRSDPSSTMFGDGATAQVVGPVAEGYGILGEAHASDGTVFGGVVTGVPGKKWYGSGAVISYIHDTFRGRQMFLKLGDISADVIARALKAAGLEPRQINFLAAHQPATWFGTVCKEAAGLVNAKAVDTFSWAGNLIGCNLPMVIATAEKEHVLNDGDLVCMVSGAAGQTASASIVRWGGKIGQAISRVRRTRKRSSMGEAQ